MISDNEKYDNQLKYLLGRIYVELEESRKRGDAEEYQITLSKGEFDLMDAIRSTGRIERPPGYIAQGSLTSPQLMTAHGYSFLLSTYFDESNNWPIDIAFKDLKYEVSIPAVDPGVTTIPDALLNVFKRGKRNKKAILDNISGSFKAGKMTLVLGPPGAGISTLFKALSDTLVVSKSGTFEGKIQYGGYDQSEVLVRKFAAYVDQLEIHTGTLTVRETLEFAFECFGGKARYLGVDLEKVSLVDKTNSRVLTFAEVQKDLVEYVLRRFGLKNCEDTIVGNPFIRGISGGEMRRLSTTEMFVGNKKVMFFDQLSTGLDSATTFDIIRDLSHWSRNMGTTFIFSLLQPTPEVFELFDEVMILAEGRILFHGERDKVLPFFESVGLKCPEKKDTADFLQEVTTKQRARYISSDQKSMLDNKGIALKWANSSYSKIKRREVENLFKMKPDKNLISTRVKYGNSIYCLDFITDLKYVLKRQARLFYRNKPYLIARVVQSNMISIFLGTVFYNLQADLSEASLIQQRLGLVFYVCLQCIFSGFALLPHIFETRAVFYKQRRSYLHRVSTYVLSSYLVAIPMQLFESVFLVSVMFWLSNLVPRTSDDAVNVYFFTILVVWLLTMVLAGYFRFIACASSDPSIAFVFSGISVATFILFSGFIILPDNMSPWVAWIYWSTPVSWAIRSIAKRVIESSAFPEEQSKQALAFYSIEEDPAFVVYGVLYLLVFIVVVHLILVIVMTNVRYEASGKRRTVEFSGRNRKHLEGSPRQPAMSSQRVAGSMVRKILKAQEVIPTTLVFKNLEYEVPIRKNGTKKLLNGISGYAKPGTITALMGASGAGKTTLMDVIAGRKTVGNTTGEIFVNGIPKPKSFASQMGYVEQTDVHCPHQTVWESIFFSARLRQNGKISTKDINQFVEVVLDILELSRIAHFEVGVTGEGGLSKEQAKRLTIGVELAANPSVLFCDEPTSGLDSRAAEVIMESIKRVSQSGRTVICTIHQPNREIFELFDKILLLQKGGRTVYFGDLGKDSCNLVSYFESIKGTPKIPNEKYNPATYMLECIGAGTSERNIEERVDYAKYYEESDLSRELQKQLQSINEQSDSTILLQKALKGDTRGASLLTQAFLLTRRASKTFWRNPRYNIVRFINMLVMALIWGLTYLNNAAKGPDFTATTAIGLIGVLFTSVMFIGAVNMNLCLQPMFREKAPFLREKASMMYHPSMYLLSWTLVELPYLAFNSFFFCVVFYVLIGFEQDIVQFGMFWLTFGLFVLIMTFLGHAGSAVFPNQQIAAIVLGLLISTFGLFAGFLVAIQDVSNFWQFMTYIVPTRYVLNALASIFFSCDCDTFAVVHKQCNSTSLGCTLTRIPGNSEVMTTWDVLGSIYGFTDSISSDLVALLIFLVAYRVIALLGVTLVKSKR